MATTRNSARGRYPGEPAGRDRAPGRYPAGPVETWDDADAVGTWQEEEGWAADYRPERSAPQRRGTDSLPRPAAPRESVQPRQAQPRQAQPRQAQPDPDDPHWKSTKRGMDQWMEQSFKFGGSQIKRRTLALLLIGSFGALPLFFMLPALLQMNENTFSVSVDDTLGTGAEVCLFLSLLVSPMMLLTGLRWFFPLRRWFGIMMACCAIGDALAAGLTDNFAGSFLSKVTEHTFTLAGFTMVLLVIPLLLTGNPWAQRKLGRYWKMLHRLIYVIWGLLFVHLATLEGFGFERRDNGSGFSGDGDPIFHQRLYQYAAVSLFLLTLRLPPVKRWIVARQQEGRNKLVWLTITPIFVLFLFGMVFILNELFFKGINSFNNTPSNE
jgi:DMSO/TMAO reductase YedYZ heme-binding membrane subunit